MNELAKRNGSDVATTSKNPFEQYSAAAESNRIVGDLLKFVDGAYFAGRDSEEVPLGTELIAIMDEMLVGWLKWEDSRPTDMRLGKVSEGFMPARRAELGDDNKDSWEIRGGTPRDPWALTNILILKGVETDRLFTFTTSSKGGIGALAKLAGVYGKHMRQKPDEFPVVALTGDKYKHRDKSLGFVDFPIFDIVGWVDKAASIAALAGEIAAEKQAAIDEEEPDWADKSPKPAKDDVPFDEPKKPASYKDKAAAAKAAPGHAPAAKTRF